MIRACSLALLLALSCSPAARSVPSSADPCATAPTKWTTSAAAPRLLYPLDDGTFMSRDGAIVPLPQSAEPAPAECLPRPEKAGADQGDAAGKLGFKDADGRWAIAPRFIYAYPFSNGLAAVGLDDGDDDRRVTLCTYVARDGALLAQRFRSCDTFREGVASVMTAEGKSYVIRTTGEPLTAGTTTASWGPQEAAVSEGRLALTDEASGKTGFVDASGRWKIRPRFAAAADFSDGLAAVWIRERPDEEGGVGFVDGRGKLVIPPTFPFLTGWTPSFSEGLALMPALDTTQYEMDHGTAQMGFIDKTGKWMLTPRYDASSEPFRGGLAHVYVRGSEHYIDHAGTRIGPNPPR